MPFETPQYYSCCSVRPSRSSHLERIWRDHCQEPRVPTRVLVAGIVTYVWRLEGARAEARLQLSPALGPGVTDSLSGPGLGLSEALALALEPPQADVGDASNTAVARSWTMRLEQEPHAQRIERLCACCDEHLWFPSPRPPSPTLP